MKVLIVLLALSVSLFAAAAAPAKKDSVKAIPKVQVQQVQKSDFDVIQVDFKKQLVDLDKKKEEQKTAITKMEKDNSLLDSKSDSVYVAAKVALKTVYDKELAKLIVQETEIITAKAKLEAAYQDAVKTLEDAKRKK